MQRDTKENVGVYELITELCNKAASKCSQSKVSQKVLATKMRSHSYEIILRKSKTEIPISCGDPIKDLLSYQFILHSNVKNVAEYKRSIELKNAINCIRKIEFGESKDCVYSTLRLLIGLRNCVKYDFSEKMFQNPFSFGLLDEMLPKPSMEMFGSPQPYPYFPSYVFELPYSLRTQAAAMDAQRSQTHTEYTVESYDSRSFLPDNYSHSGAVETKTFLSPMSLASLTSSAVSAYSESTMLNYPRLTGPRDLQIPSPQTAETNVKVSLASLSEKSDIKEVYRAKSDESDNIWELAARVDKDVPLDIWEYVSKLPPVNERQIIASSTRELGLWRRLYSGSSDLHVISEKQFIRHIMYLIIGVQTSSFPFSEETNSFYMKENLVLEGISKERVAGYVSSLLSVGTYYRRLYDFAFNQTIEDHLNTKGLIYEAVREEARKYLLRFRLVATAVFEARGRGGEPTLLQILHHVEPLLDEIETVASVYKLTDGEGALPRGAELMSHLFNEISLVTHRRAARALHAALRAVCAVYFRFIERFIFEGTLCDAHGEFFVRCDAAQAAGAPGARYWERGYRLSRGAAPAPLRPLAPAALLAGKTLRLLNLCNPNEGLVALSATCPPTVRCCGSFAALAAAERALAAHRARCLLAGGAGARACRELAAREDLAARAAAARAETVERIQAERRRLAQLIAAEKQHSMRALKASIAEARAARAAREARETRPAAPRAADAVDARLRDDESNKMMEYYSKLNMEVEKNKIHTEWKIKRLQLDQSRIQLLSTEERNLKREKLELEHQRNEAVMQMSIQSCRSDDDIYDNNDNTNAPNDNNNGNVDNSNGNDNDNPPTTGSAMTDSATSVDLTVIQQQSEIVSNKAKAESSSDVFSAICNVAKSIFGVSKPKWQNVCDNEVMIDSQGNVIARSTGNETNFSTSNEVIGANLNDAHDNQRFLEMRQEAMKNKEKVMAHEFGSIDNDNNEIRNAPPLIKLPSVDEENNEEDWTPHAEAIRNKKKVLGAEFELIKEETKPITVEPRTEAQREAVVNKQKVLGVEYNLPAEVPSKKIAQNVAQEEAIRNRDKVLGSEYETGTKSMPKAIAARKSSLTLNLKPYGETSQSNFGSSSSTGMLTPGEFLTGLDLETPTTADIPTDGPVTSDVFTPRSDTSKDLESKAKPDKHFLTADGFDFSLIVDEGISDAQTESPENSPSKTIDSCDAKDINAPPFNILDGSYNLEGFDPFGVKDLEGYPKDYFNNKMASKSPSIYTHPAVIMEEVKKKPYNNIFAPHYDLEEQDDGSSDNIATLMACLQRSVMLPLTYQLEVVNNSILTYFLVNLDLYEHLRCLKDYFLLMDGEFSRTLCDNLFSKLNKTVNPQELLNFATLHNILDKALGSSISHVSKFSDNLSFTLVDAPLSFAHGSPDALAALALSYAVRAPLDIVLSPEAMRRYVALFHFRLKMRRVSWTLADGFEWLKLSTKRHGAALARSAQFVRIRLRRHALAAAARALDAYAAGACAARGWARLGAALRAARTLDEVRREHAAYLKRLMFRCLLNNRSTPVMKLLNDIFTVILKFSRVLKSGEWRQSEPGGQFAHSGFAQLEELFHLFEKLTRYLHKVVARLAECGYQRHLQDLLTMINMNGYYDHVSGAADAGGEVSVQSV